MYIIFSFLLFVLPHKCSKLFLYIHSDQGETFFHKACGGRMFACGDTSFYLCAMKSDMIIYILAYWIGCVVLLVCCQCFFSWRQKKKCKYSLKFALATLFGAPFVIPLTPIVFGIDYIFRRYIKKDPRMMSIDEYEREQRKQRNAKCREYGIPEGTHYLSFEHISGAGTVYCKDCGHREHVIGFTHGAYECEIGRQCPHCHAFVTEHNESNHYHTFGPFNGDFLCPKCGGVVRAEDEDWDKGNDVPLFCPQCHGYNLEYYMEYIT